MLLAVLCAPAQPAWGKDRSKEHLATQVSDATVSLLALGELSLLTDGRCAKQEMLDGAEAVVATDLITMALKKAVREKRPHSDAHDSFPSGHTSVAFAMATVVADYKPKYRWLAYGAASVVGWSRVESGAHRWREVVAGAALGHFVAKRFTKGRILATPDGIACVWDF
jgi:hypothetical protein